MKRFVLAAILMATTVGGCASVAVNSTFDPNAAAYINQQGTNTITGQAFLRRNDGMVVYGAGSEVELIPVTAYTQARVAAIFKGGKFAYPDAFTGGQVTVKDEDPQFAKFVRKAVANGEGRFTFEGVADGSYYITVPVVWMVQAYQGGTLLGEATVSGGQKIEVIINGQ